MLSQHKSTLKEIAFILSMVVFIAIVYNFVSPDAIPFFPKDKSELTVSDSLLFADTSPQDSLINQTDSAVVEMQTIDSSRYKELINKDTTQLTKKEETPLHTSIESHGTKEYKIVSYEQMLKIIGSPNFVIIDARRPEDFAKEHISNSINIFPYADESEYIPKLMNVPTDKTIVIYCDGGTCDLSHEVAKALTNMFGHSKVYIYEGGWEEWSQKRKNS